MRSSFVVLRIGTVPIRHWSFWGPSNDLVGDFFTVVFPIDFLKAGFSLFSKQEKINIEIKRGCNQRNIEI